MLENKMSLLVTIDDEAMIALVALQGTPDSEGSIAADINAAVRRGLLLTKKMLLGADELPALLAEVQAHVQANISGFFTLKQVMKALGKNLHPTTSKSFGKLFADTESPDYMFSHKNTQNTKVYARTLTPDDVREPRVTRGYSV